MEREIILSEGIVIGDDMRDILTIIPELNGAFTRRKQYNEYYFKPQKIYLDEVILEQLSSVYSINLSWSTLEINL